MGTFSGSLEMVTITGSLEMEAGPLLLLTHRVRNGGWHTNPEMVAFCGSLEKVVFSNSLERDVLMH